MNKIIFLMTRLVFFAKVICIIALAFFFFQTYTKIVDTVNSSALAEARTEILESTEVPWYIRNDYAIAFIVYVNQYVKTAEVTDNEVLLEKTNGETITIHFKDSVAINETIDFFKYLEIKNFDLILNLLKAIVIFTIFDFIFYITSGIVRRLA